MTVQVLTWKFFKIALAAWMVTRILCEGKLQRKPIRVEGEPVEALMIGSR